MQIPASAQAPASRLTDRSALLVPQVMKLLTRTPRAQRLRDFELEQQDQDLASATASAEAATARAMQAPRNSDVLHQDEQAMRSGSNAARRADLRAALAQAHSESRGPGGQSRAAGETPAGTQSKGLSTASAGTEIQNATTSPTANTPPRFSSSASPGQVERVAASNTAPPNPTLNSTNTAATTIQSAVQAAVTSPVTTTAAPSTPNAPIPPAGVQAIAPAGPSTTGAPTGAPATTQDPGIAPAFAGGVARGATKSGARQALPDTPNDPPAGEIDTNFERFLRLLRSRLGTERSVANLRLDPPELGTVRLRMELRDHQVRIEADTETSAAQRLLLEHVDELRQRLEASGLQLERCEVRPPAGTEAQDQPRSDGHGSPSDFGGLGGRSADSSASGQAGHGSADGGTPRGPAVSSGRSPAEPWTRGGNFETAAESLVNILA